MVAFHFSFGLRFFPLVIQAKLNNAGAVCSKLDRLKGQPYYSELEWTLARTEEPVCSWLGHKSKIRLQDIAFINFLSLGLSRLDEEKI